MLQKKNLNSAVIVEIVPKLATESMHYFFRSFECIYKCKDARVTKGFRDIEAQRISPRKYISQIAISKFICIHDTYSWQVKQFKYKLTHICLVLEIFLKY